MTVIEDSTFMKVKALVDAIDSNVAEVTASSIRRLETTQVLLEMLGALLQEIEEHGRKEDCYGTADENQNYRFRLS